MMLLQCYIMISFFNIFFLGFITNIHMKMILNVNTVYMGLYILFIYDFIVHVNIQKYTLKRISCPHSKKNSDLSPQ